MKPWLTLAAALAAAVPTAAVVAIPAPALAQSQAGRTLSPAEVRELRAQLTVLQGQRDTARRQVVSARADFRRVAVLLGLPADTSAEAVAQHLERWAEQDQKNRDELARLTEIVARIDSGEVKDAAEAHLRDAQAAFEDGRLEDADRALAQLESLRGAQQAEARQLWIDAILARSALADQRQDGETARRLAREARQEERARSNHDQWRLAIREAESFTLEDPRRRDNQALEDAIAVYRDEALPLIDRTRHPDDWAMTQHRLGLVLWKLGQRELETLRLEEAVTAYRAALEERPRDRVPLDWAATQDSLGVALTTLGSRTMGNEQLQLAVATHEIALLELTRERSPLDWARAQSNLGGALAALGERELGTERLKLAVAAYEAALLEENRDVDSMAWATNQNNLAGVLYLIGQRELGTDRLRQSASYGEAALLVITREVNPRNWAVTKTNLGHTFLVLADRDPEGGWLEQAMASYQSALLEMTRERDPLQWSKIQAGIGHAFSLIARREENPEFLDRALIAYRIALQDLNHEQNPQEWITAYIGLMDVLFQSARISEEYSEYIRELSKMTYAIHIVRENKNLEWVMSIFSHTINAEELLQSFPDSISISDGDLPEAE